MRKPKYDLSEGLVRGKTTEVGDLRYCDRHGRIEVGARCSDCDFFWWVESTSAPERFKCECCGKEFQA